MNIIKLNINHIDFLLDLENKCFHIDSWNFKMLETELLNEKNINIGYLENGKLVGYLITLNLGDEVEVLRIGVHPNFRNRGIAKNLFNSFFDILKTQQIKKVFLEVSENNKFAKFLYESLGFKKLYTRKNYYENGLSADIYGLEI